MPALKRLGDITYDQDSESIAVVHLAYSTGTETTYTEGRPVEKERFSDHEGQPINIKKLNDHLNNFLAPKLAEKIKYASFVVKEFSASETGTITLKIARWDNKKVNLTKTNISNGLTGCIDIALREINTDLENAIKAKEKLVEKVVEPVKSAPAKSTTASTGLFSPEATRAFQAEIIAAIAKAKAEAESTAAQAPTLRAKL